MKKIILAVSAVILIVVTALLYHALFSPDRPFLTRGSQTRPNLILITVDTLRADHMGLYGYEYNTTPNIDEFSRQAAVFEYAYCPIPKTSASFASMMTGLHPFVHQTDPNRDSLKPKFITLAEVLKMKGYYTHAVVDNSNLARRFHFDQGFDEYIEVWNHKEKKSDSTVFITRKGLEFLQKKHLRPFFLWLHYIEPHSPYVPPRRFVEERPPGRLIESVEKKLILGEHQKITPDAREGEFTALYDGTVRYMDAEFKKLTDRIRERKLHSNSVVIFTSDHGEELGEKNVFYGHGQVTFSASIRVPLIVSGPGIRPRRISQAVSIMDIYPTFLRIIGLQPAYDLQGHDLFAPSLEKRAFFIYGITTFSVVQGHYHYVHNSEKIRNRLGYPVSFFYDVAEDPAEKKDISYRNKPLQQTLLAEYRDYFTAHNGYGTRRIKKGKAEEYTDAERRNLKTLGYLD